jgi:hypothetical protein
MQMPDETIEDQFITTVKSPLAVRNSVGDAHRDDLRVCRIDLPDEALCDVCALGLLQCVSRVVDLGATNLVLTSLGVGMEAFTVLIDDI